MRKTAPPGEKLADTLFYSLEKTLKTYRQFAQQNLRRAGFDITIDQWLVLKTLQDNPETTLAQVARDVFKDVASITRIVQLLESKGYVTRVNGTGDKRRAALALTKAGTSAIRSVKPVIERNRRLASNGISASQIRHTHSVCDAIISNCEEIQTA